VVVKSAKPRTARGKSVRKTVAGTSGLRTGIKRADYVSAFARGLEILRLFGRETPRLTVSMAAERTGLSRAAARRFLLTLNELGYVHMADELFELRPKVLELGYAYLSAWPTAELVTPYLRDGVRVMNENVSFGVLDGDQAVYVARAEARRLVQSLVITVGSRVPAVLSAMGRVLIAHQPPDVIDDIIEHTPLPRFTPSSIQDPRHLRRILDEVRQKGWCLVTEEFEQGVMSVAVPIVDENNAVVAAINVGAPTTRATPVEMVEYYLPRLQDVGNKISRAIVMSGARIGPLTQNMVRGVPKVPLEKGFSPDLVTHPVRTGPTHGQDR
jgi:IclR family pca regulon transcriptional regulator